MPSRKRIEFPNADGQMLAAALELPDTDPKAYAVFAHCFTCGKDIAAASRISRTLAANGIAVLRFDFTGLGGSDGDFANTNFTSNAQDLLAAVAFLRAQYQAPALLIGHSLGGTAVLAVAAQVPETRAVVTIGAPAAPDHVLKQFKDSQAKIADDGEAVVSLAGRDFTIRQQFIDDLQTNPLSETLPRLKKALLIFHAPFDTSVSIDNAGELFVAAKHPKSFISLDGADHLVSRLEDAQYVAETLCTWASRYLDPVAEAPAPDVPGGEVLIAEGNHRFLRQVSTDDHAWVADEPKRVGGNNLGPDPYEHLLAALGTCTSMTIRMYANRKKWPLEDIDVQLRHDREHSTDCEGCEDKPLQIDVLSRTIRLVGELDEDQRARLMQIADRCPVHRTLEGQLEIRTTAANP
jgi:putative redox protein